MSTTETSTEPSQVPEGEKQLSKTQLKKLAAKQEKEAKKAAKQAELDAKRKLAAEKLLGGENFGTRPIIMSSAVTKSTVTEESYASLRALDATFHDKEVLLRARVHNTRGQGNLCFLVLRDTVYTVQAVVAKSDVVSKEMVTFASRLPCESIVDVTGTIRVPEVKLENVTQNDVELQVSKLFVVSTAKVPLPLQLDDCVRSESILSVQREAVKGLQEKLGALTLDKSKEDLEKSPLKEEVEKMNAAIEAEKKFVDIGEKTRLDYRVVEMRSSTSNAVFRLSSSVCRYFRDFLLDRDFVEIHTPKLIGCASEGGAAVFEVKYFETKAYLAQSPQLYKQMCICGDLKKVFEVGPVFRAEKSNSHRHLTEFMGLDLEMEFKEDYHEVLMLIMNMLVSVFANIEKNCQKEIETVRQQFDVPKLVYSNFKIFKFSEIVALLRSAGIERKDLEDLNTAEEILLGKLIKEKHGTDFYAVDKFPLAVRPFYTMPDPDSEQYSNGFDIFLRGQEISSGAQRVHDFELLKKRAAEANIEAHTIQGYVDAFEFGAPPHAGCGLGLERVVMLFLGLKDVRQTCLFPRDPQRLTP